ncbi:MAG: prolipoprotein diacylglyceryl transferase [Sandaracinaceae bacterium]|nr:prolipoprotein diacylglyceryl transferase [Sandaracinaceae bacterium]
MHPVLFELGSLRVFSYGVMLGVSLIVAWFLIMWLCKRERFSRDVAATAYIVTAVTALAGSRLLYVVTNPDEFAELGQVLALSTGGLVAYGGFLGGLAGAAIYLGIRRMSLLSWGDMVAPALGTGLGLTRIGCYLFGCDFGARLSDAAPGWLQSLGTFPSGSPAHLHHVATLGLSRAAAESYAVHPTQLYESLAGVALFGVAMTVWRYRKFRGQVLLVVALLYGVWRFGIEYVRDDPERGFAFGFSTSQLISLLIVPVCALLYFVLHRAHAQGRALDEPAPQPVLPKTTRKSS